MTDALSMAFRTLGLIVLTAIVVVSPVVLYLGYGIIRWSPLGVWPVSAVSLLAFGVMVWIGLPFAARVFRSRWVRWSGLVLAVGAAAPLAVRMETVWRMEAAAEDVPGDGAFCLEQRRKNFVAIRDLDFDAMFVGALGLDRSGRPAHAWLYTPDTIYLWSFHRSEFVKHRRSSPEFAASRFAACRAALGLAP